MTDAVRAALAELVAATDPNGDTPADGWKSAWRKARAALSEQPAHPAPVEQVHEQLAEAVRDAERLTYLEGDEMKRVFKIGKTWYWKPAYGMPHRKAKTLREAIDAALQEQKS